MTHLSALNILVGLGVGALGLCLGLVLIFRSSLRANRRSRFERERVRSVVESARSTLLDLQMILAAEPGVLKPIPPEAPVRREPGGGPPLGREETDLLQKIRMYQLGRQGEKSGHALDGRNKFHSTPAIS